jgi:hypothetical protein
MQTEIRRARPRHESAAVERSRRREIVVAGGHAFDAGIEAVFLAELDPVSALLHRDSGRVRVGLICVISIANGLRPACSGSPMGRLDESIPRATSTSLRNWNRRVTLTVGLPRCSWMDAGAWWVRQVCPEKIASRDAPNAP